MDRVDMLVAPSDDEKAGNRFGQTATWQVVDVDRQHSGSVYVRCMCDRVTAAPCSAALMNIFFSLCSIDFSYRCYDISRKRDTGYCNHASFFRVYTSS